MATEKSYAHHWITGEPVGLPAGKVVCVGMNYLRHIHELGSVVPEKPVIFMKPSSSLRPISEPVEIPGYGRDCHHEIEVAVLVGTRIKSAGPEHALSAVTGYALALDLTLRDVQAELKKRGHPWELAKAFDKSCPISPFVPASVVPDPGAIKFALAVNGVRRQDGDTAMMMTGIAPLLSYISGFITLNPGDVVLTGTPEGVASLSDGDNLRLELAGRYVFETGVRRYSA